jgi:hypothetical protein
VRQELLHVTRVVGIYDRDEQMLPSSVGDVGEIEALDLRFCDPPGAIPLREAEPQDAYVGGAARVFILRVSGDGHVDQQLADVLRARIAKGEWRSGPLPSVKQLQQEYGVGRDTVLRAVEILRTEGLVFTVPRRGTYVTPDTK